MFLIRVATSPNLGKGHFSRCVRIRSVIKHKVIWLIDKGTKDLYFKKSKDQVVEENSNTSFLQLKKYILDKRIKAIMIDNPKLNSNDIKKYALLKPIIVLVDNFTVYKNALSICMHPINKNNKNFLSGLKYLPLKKKPLNKNKKTENILVSFGNVDKNCITESVVKVLIDIFSNKLINANKFKINIVLGAYKKNKNNIKKIVSAYDNFQVYDNIYNMEELYKQSSFAIGAPGFSQLERIEYRIPSILIAQNKTQQKLLNYWKSSGCALVVKNIETELKKNLFNLISSNKVKSNINKSFDYNGAKRIYKNIEIFLSKV